MHSWRAAAHHEQPKKASATKQPAAAKARAAKPRAAALASAPNADSDDQIGGAVDDDDDYAPLLEIAQLPSDDAGAGAAGARGGAIAGGPSGKAATVAGAAAADAKSATPKKGTRAGSQQAAQHAVQSARAARPSRYPHAAGAEKVASVQQPPNSPPAAKRIATKPAAAAAQLPAAQPATSTGDDEFSAHFSNTTGANDVVVAKPPAPTKPQTPKKGAARAARTTSPTKKMPAKPAAAKPAAAKPAAAKPAVKLAAKPAPPQGKKKARTAAPVADEDAAIEEEDEEEEDWLADEPLDAAEPPPPLPAALKRKAPGCAGTAPAPPSAKPADDARPLKSVQFQRQPQLEAKGGSSGGSFGRGKDADKQLASFSLSKRAAPAVEQLPSTAFADRLDLARAPGGAQGEMQAAEERMDDVLADDPDATAKPARTLAALAPVPVDARQPDGRREAAAIEQQAGGVRSAVKPSAGWRGASVLPSTIKASRGGAATAQTLDTPLDSWLRERGVTNKLLPKESGGSNGGINLVTPSAPLADGAHASTPSASLRLLVGDEHIAKQTAACILKVIALGQKTAKRKLECFEKLERNLVRNVDMLRVRCAQELDDSVQAIGDDSKRDVSLLYKFYDRTEAAAVDDVDSIRDILADFHARDEELAQRMRDIVANGSAEVRAARAEASRQLTALTAQHAAEMRRDQRGTQAGASRHQSGVFQAFSAAMMQILG